MSIAVIYGGNRPNGNTESLTKLATLHLEVEEIYLSEYHIEPIIDKRHDPEGFSDIDDDYNTVIDKVLAHDILIFSTPIYWYTMTGIMKNFIDRWSHMMRDENRPTFKEEIAKKHTYVIAVGGDSPYIKGLPMIQQFKHIFDFMGMTFEDYIIGEANAPGEITQDVRALVAAEQLRKKLEQTQKS
ncbi:flavodoxin family protein [Ornithinibacillus sp. 4-3]|uniref:Flavodoxin family protein n=1 Tax=Ornithinibacillus sp. 4-3 TaxID=3231488 RepID=A0AB39HMZ3_9BACI